MKKINYLLKNILLFTISGFIPKILSFLLIPIYTSCLSTSDYGLSDLITTTVSLFIPIFTLDIQDAVLVYSMDKKYKKEDIFSTTIKINFIGFIVTSIIIYIIYKLNIFSVNSYFYIFFLINYIVTAVSNSTNLFCKGIDKIKSIVVSTILNSLITLTLNIVLLKFLNMGIMGYLIANTTGIIVALLYVFFDANLFKYIKKIDNKEVVYEMLKFSFPLIFSVLAWWINNASDRYILTWIMGVSVSGLYAISYKIPNLLTVFQNVFSQAWSISAIKEFDSEDKDGFVGNMYTMMNFSLCLICSIIMILNVTIAKILYSGEFFMAWKFVPPLLISVVFNAMSLFIGSIFTAVKDTKTLSISTIIGALVNTILNLILIKYYSAYGAAVATAIGYFVVLIMRNLILKKHIKMKTNPLKNNFCYMLIFIQIILSCYGNKFILFQVLIPISILILYKENISKIKKYIYNIVRKNSKRRD